MSYLNKILEMARNNHGMITSSMVDDAGIARMYLKMLVDDKKLEKSVRGVYVLPEVIEDEFVRFQSRYKKGIYSKETALFLHDLTDRTPIAFSMTFPGNYNLTKVKIDGIKADRSNNPYYSLGIIAVLSPSGNKVQVYDIEKTLCDILRPRSNIERSIVNETFKRYLSRNNKNIPKLSKYAKLLKVDAKVRQYLEVLL